MNRLLVLLMLVFPSLSWAGDLTVTSSDLGVNNQFSTATAKLELRNKGNRIVKIMKCVALEPHDRVVSPVPSQLESGQSVVLDVHVETRNDVGNRWHLVRVLTDEKEDNEYLARIHNFGYSVLDDAKPLIDFGVVEASSLPVTRSITLASRDDPTFRLLAVDHAPDFASARISNDGKDLSVTLRGDAAWGRYIEPIQVRVQSAMQKQVWVEVRADIHGSVVPDANPFEFGLFKQGERHESLLRILDRTGKPLKLGAIKLEGFKGAVTTKLCIPVADACRLLALNVSDDQPTGKLVGRILLNLPDYGGRVLPIDTWGMLVKKDTKILSLDDAIKRNESPESKAGGKAADLHAALEDAVTPSAPRATQAKAMVPTGDGPLLKWTVANEAGIYGYLIYRSSAAAGPSQRINDRIIPANVDVEKDAPSTYEWRDASATAGATYWYSIGVIYADGHKRLLSSPEKVVAK